MVCNKHDMETKNDGVQHKIMTTKYMKTVFALLVDCRVCCQQVYLNQLNFPLPFVEHEFATDADEQFGES